MVEVLKEKWTGAVFELTIGATAKEGGSRQGVIKVGGQNALSFMPNEGSMPNAPVVSMEILDVEPTDWPEILKAPFKGVLKNPVKWAQKCVEEYNAKILCLRLQGTHPDFGNAGADEAAGLVKNILKSVGVPLIIIGSGDNEKDNLVLPKCCEVSKGENCLIGEAIQQNYKTLTASCLADGHSIIAQSPIDINIAKQLNILISDMGFKLDKIVINPTIGALGYGIEYAYSIMERGRLAALGGDKLLSMPFICFVGHEAWRAKEAKISKMENPAWGDEKYRGPAWEATTAVCMLQAGADILVMRHPVAIESVNTYIENITRSRPC